MNIKKFDINQIFDLSIQLNLKFFFDRLNQIIKKFAFNIQRAISKYRIKKFANIV